MKHIVEFGQIRPSLPLFDITDPGAIVRLSLSIIVIGIAVVGGRWLATLASKVPSSYLQRRLSSRGDKLADGGRTADRALGAITLISVGLVAAVVLLLIWITDVKQIAQQVSP